MRTHKFDHVWHVGETANPFEVQLVLDDGFTPRVGVLWCTFKMVNLDDLSSVLIGPVDCAIIDEPGVRCVCSYTPTVDEMTTKMTARVGEPIRFLAQYNAMLADGSVLPTVYVEGRVEANL